MDWKKIAIQDLKNHNAHCLALQTITEDIYRLQRANTGIKSALQNTNPVHGGNSNNADKLISNMVMIEKLKLNRNTIKQIVNRVERGLSVLDNKEYTCLQYRYIYGLDRNNSIEHIAEAIGYERSATYKVLSAALLKFTRAMYGLVDV